MNLLTLAATTLLAGATFAAPPAPGPGGTAAATAATDDLIEMARYQIDTERDTTVHYHPEEAIVIDEDTELAGTWIVDSFEVREDAIVVATSDLTVVARHFISVEGQVLGAHHCEGGASLLLRSFEWISVTGEVRAGSGVGTRTDHRTGAKAPDGGDLWIVSPEGIAPGSLWAGDGGDSAILANGGDGGDSIIMGGIFGTDHVRTPMIYAGRGGEGGASADATVAGSMSSGGNGGRGGDAISHGGRGSWDFPEKPIPFCVKARSFASCAPVYAASLSGNIPVAMVASAMINDPEPTSCWGGKGADGTDVVLAITVTEGSSGGTADPPAYCCTNGVDGTTHGAGATGGVGGAGGIGMPPSGSVGDGGNGGQGGVGGDAVGGTGENGSDATDCCEAAGAGCAAPYVQTGGNGADGGNNAFPGAGGPGGVGALAHGEECLDGTDGEGGPGGDKIGGYGGDGGALGKSTLGKRHPDRPWRGGGGAGGGFDQNCGGAPGGLDGWNGNPNATQYWYDLLDNATWPDHGSCGSAVKGEPGVTYNDSPEEC